MQPRVCDCGEEEKIQQYKKLFLYMYLQKYRVIYLNNTEKIKLTMLFYNQPIYTCPEEKSVRNK